MPQATPTEREIELQQQNEQLRLQLQQQQAVVDATPAGVIAKAKKAFKLPKGEEGYTHVLETQVNGETLAEPRVRAYDPHTYASLISKQHGYQADILHTGQDNE